MTDLLLAQHPTTDLRVSLIQSDLAWGDKAENLDHFTLLLASLTGQTDLILLPEMFTTGFTMQPELYAEREHAEGETLDWMRERAARVGAAIAGSFVVEAQGSYLNRFYLVTPEGEATHYDKRHLYRRGNEHRHYRAGGSRVVINYRGWRILPQICNDLRFPVFSRNQSDYDLILYTANWPEPRNYAWRAMLQARAAENLAYVLGVNRIGLDANGMNHTGDSQLIDFTGRVLIDGEPNQPLVATGVLSADALLSFRAEFQTWLDADRFELITAGAAE